MKTTQNFGLRKPDQEDFYNIDDFNFNADVIDQELFYAKTTANTANQKADQNASALAAHLNENAIDAHATIPAVKVFSNVNQLIPSRMGTRLFFDTVYFDTDGMFDPNYNDRLTCHTPGKYLIICNVKFEANAVGIRDITIFLNDVFEVAKNEIANSGSDGETVTLSLSTLLEMSEGDFITVTASQSSGTSLNVLSFRDYTPTLMMIKVG